MANILVVDGEKNVRITLREFLTDADYEVGVAEDADREMEILGCWRRSGGAQENQVGYQTGGLAQEAPLVRDRGGAEFLPRPHQPVS